MQGDKDFMHHGTKIVEPTCGARGKGRGRPRQYEPDAALLQAMDVFWRRGYAAASLDELSLATGINWPSLYAAFGDKRDIYEKAYRKYRERMREEFRPLIEANGEVRKVLADIFDASLALYISGPEGPRGCLTVVTVASEAIADPDIQKLALEAIRALDDTFALVLSKAIARGELPRLIQRRRARRIATATLHTLAIRARAEVPKRVAEIARDAVALICGDAGRELLS